MAEKEHNVYMPGYSAAAVRHHEWRTAENSAVYLLPELQRLAKRDPNLKLLDVGAGSGTITASLAKYMPDGELVASDLSEGILRRAAEHAAAVGSSNIKFEQANIYELSKRYQPESFTVVHASMVLCHLDDPVSALSEMLKVTKPGGVVAVRESDLRMWSYYPDLPEIAAFHKILMATLEASGGSKAGGSQLVSWAMKAGVKREGITASMGNWCYSTPAEREIWGGTMAERIRNGEMRKKALSMGIATEAELESCARGWEEWIATDDACFGCMHGEVLVHK